MQQANSNSAGGVGLSTPRAQFINNGFGLGGFLGKRGLFERVFIIPMRFYVDICYCL